MLKKIVLLTLLCMTAPLFTPLVQAQTGIQMTDFDFDFDKKKKKKKKRRKKGKKKTKPRSRITCGTVPAWDWVLPVITGKVLLDLGCRRRSATKSFRAGCRRGRGSRCFTPAKNIRATRLSVCSIRK